MASDGGNSNAGSTNEKAVTGTGGQQPSEQDPKEGKKFFKFVFNVNKKVTDETEMTQDFINDLKHYQEFDETVGKCSSYLENIFIPFSSKSSKNEEDSFARLAKALGEFKSYVPQNHVPAFENFSAKMKAAAASRKSYQAVQSYHIRHMKRFHEQHYDPFMAQRKRFDDARRKMDQAKADVRDAKTTTAIEKKAICYQLTVDDFDQQTEDLIKIIEELPKVKQGYVRDIFVLLTKHKLYHIDMSKYFAASCI
ncbi:Protein CBG12489 [Caenorhabditis briggsae]|uniref:BAR domain-containing protein n=3 Tax=Caenorhabditis TaxID=6237 RepID=A0AAE9DX99_CAEBR|nr:Protein CBG12489 [Caenorhabditis briggsae]PIC52017.1 hypothetical protein B9Z55_002294 [Caenorhabditis nigoni]ULU12547.1 hypothetical protein L3Y34_015658 [Caenorhabditis briggsae]UMM13493.1 hypothetical protein L5515_001735 [Caenorhabditis briggsae]CAP31464.1 Protein CBG12489 [Caenorhabditis briggsae]